MAWNNTQFDDALKRKYDVAQQGANADTTRANAAMQSVQQQPLLHQMDNSAAFDRTKYSSDTQNQMNSRDNTTKQNIANQNYSLGQAELGLKGAIAADDSTYKMGSLSRNEYDAFGNIRKDGVKTSGPTYMDMWNKNNSARGFGLSQPGGQDSSNSYIPGYKNGGDPPVNHPFVVGEKGPELFIPGDGSEPFVVGANGPTVMTVPRRGEIIPNDKIVQQARQSLSAPPWASGGPISPKQRESGLSPDGVILPREASSEIVNAARSKLSAPTSRNVMVGAGSNQIPMHETNLYDAVQSGRAQSLQEKQESEKKPDFTPEGAIEYAGKLDAEGRAKFLAGLSEDQLNALSDYRLNQANMGRMPMQISGASSSSPQPSDITGNEQGYISEYDDGTRIVRPQGEVTYEGPDAAQRWVSRFLQSRRDAAIKRALAIDAENEDMRARQAALARRALGLGSYLVTTPDTAAFR